MPIARRVLGLLVLVSLAGCEDPQTFDDPDKLREKFVDFRNVVIAGQQRLEFRVTVQPPPAMVHPHFEGRWTFRDVEKPVDIFVYPAQDYDAGQLPSAQPYYWSSVQSGSLGPQREPGMQLHPSPGEWVIVYFNPALFGPTTRAEVSSEIELTYFR